jgi:hypothetical protein
VVESLVENGGRVVVPVWRTNSPLLISSSDLR